MTPQVLFRRVATAEAITWALLLIGMFLKYVTETTELGVQVFGMAHGVVFLTYVLVTLVVGTDQGWTTGRLVRGLLASVPPFVTIPFDRAVERTGGFGPWRLRPPGSPDAARAPHERLVAGLLAHPGRGAAIGLVAVAVLTAVALAVGPPVGK